MQGFCLRQSRSPNPYFYLIIFLLSKEGLQGRQVALEWSIGINMNLSLEMSL